MIYTGIKCDKCGEKIEIDHEAGVTALEVARHRRWEIKGWHHCPTCKTVEPKHWTAKGAPKARYV